MFAGLLRYYSQAIDGTIYYELILGILIYLKQARIHAALVEKKLSAKAVFELGLEAHVIEFAGRLMPRPIC